MSTIKTIYKGDLRTSAQHVLSGNVLITDAPLDNMGKGESFSPTDLLATSLGSCMLTIMGIAANNHSFSIDNTEVEIEKIMASNPRRVSEIVVVFNMPSFEYSDKEKQILLKAAQSCPVALSLSKELIQTIIFNFQK